MNKKIALGLIPLVFLAILISAGSCKKEEILGKNLFVYGADLSYVNQILEHGGVYRDNGQVKDPYQIFKDHGANLVRLRLWHTPTWTKDAYGSAGTKMYNDLEDVKVAIRRSKAAGLAVNLDFHYSDTWAEQRGDGRHARRDRRPQRWIVHQQRSARSWNRRRARRHPRRRRGGGWRWSRRCSRERWR